MRKPSGYSTLSKTLVFVSSVNINFFKGITAPRSTPWGIIIKLVYIALT